MNENNTTNEINLFQAINSAKISLLSATTQIMEKSGLPSCVMDGIICDVLSEIRKQEIYDMTAINRAASKPKESNEINDTKE